METPFQKALETGQVVLRRWWSNANNPDQVTLQFFQKVETQADTNSLVSIAQGIKPGQIVSALQSFKKDVVLAKLGSTEGNLVDSSSVVFARDVFGTDVSIKVTENFTPNPFSKSHEPKVNPSTGEVVLGFNSKTQQNDPVYRHTELVAGIINQEAHEWASKEMVNEEAPFAPTNDNLLTR